MSTVYFLSSKLKHLTFCYGNFFVYHPENLIHFELYWIANLHGFIININLCVYFGFQNESIEMVTKMFTNESILMMIYFKLKRKRSGEKRLIGNFHFNDQYR